MKQRGSLRHATRFWAPLPPIWAGLACWSAASLLACTAELGGAEDTESGSPTAGEGRDGDAVSIGSGGGGDGTPLGETPSTPDEVRETCQEENALLTSQLRRLSEEQIRNSIEDTFGEIFAPSVFPKMEDGARLIGMNLMGDKLNINDVNFEHLSGASRQIADTILAQDSDFSECALAASPDCVDELAATTMHRLWRGLETEQDLADLREHLSSFESNEVKLRFVLSALVLGSKFLFRSEMGTLVDQDQALENHEIVSFLSYAIYNSTPDDELLTLADQAEPLTDEQLTAQVERMIDDPRVDEGLVSLYKDFLKLELVMTREKSSEFGFDDSVRADLLTSAEMMLQSHIESGAGFMDVFGPAPMPVNQNTAGFFNASVDSEALIATDVDHRHGVLTHPAFLAVHSTLSDSGIVKRGVFTLEQLLCVELPDPPPNVTSLEPPPELDPETTSERELLVATHSSQAGCQGCHEAIDPAGFGFENYDAVGRYREVEKGSVPIDASGDLVGVGSYENGVAYAAALIASEPMQSCVTRRFLEHYFGQELQDDSCVAQYFNERLAETDGSARSLLLALSQIQTFIRSRNP